MGKFFLTIGLSLAAACLILFGSRTLLVRADARAEEAWQDLQQILEREMDLVDELKGLAKADFPESAYTDFAQARKILLTARPILRSRFQQYEETYAALAASVAEALEAVPDSSMELQAWRGRYAGTRNRSLLAGSRYNDEADQYNRLYDRFYFHFITQLFKLDARYLLSERVLTDGG